MVRAATAAAGSSKQQPANANANANGSEDGSTSAQQTAALQRGSACLACRKRKLKCDAGKPVCKQCMRANKPSECSYDNSDPRALSKTQVLQRRIRELEDKLKHLQAQNVNGSRPQTSRHSPSLSHTDSTRSHSDEPPEGAVPIIPDMYANGVPSASGYAGDDIDLDPFGVGLDADATPLGDDPSTSWAGDFAISQLSHRASGSDPSDPKSLEGVVDVRSSDWSAAAYPHVALSEKDELSPKVKRYLLTEVFLPRRHLCQFTINVDRFLASLDAQQPKKQPHPCLLDAMCLVACHLSRSPIFTQHEPHFLEKARQGLADALEHSDRLFNFVQASSLVAFYLYRRGRLIEAYHQTCQVARFAVSCGLHQIISPIIKESDSARNSRGAAPWSVTNMSVRRAGSMLDPPKDATELGERIHAFWHVFLLDKVGSIITNLPAALPDECDSFSQVETVWPRLLEEYETGDVTEEEYGTVRTLYKPDLPPPTRLDTIFTLRLKSTALFERACRLSTLYGPTSAPRTPPETFWTTFQSIDFAITRFHATLPLVRNTGEMGEVLAQPHSPVNVPLALVHTLVHVATIQLHNIVANDNTDSYNRSLQAAHGAVTIIHELADADPDDMEMILGHCWKCVADVLLRHLHHNQFSHNTATLDLELDAVVHAIKRLEPMFPLLGYQVNEIERQRNAGLTILPST